MKRFISIIFVLILLYSQTSIMGYAYKDFKLVFANNNLEFAIESSIIIDESGNNFNELVVGRFKEIPYNIELDGLKKAVISRDGRFILQFSNEKNMEWGLKSLSNYPNVVYAEKDRPICIETYSYDETASLSWGIKSIESDYYSENIDYDKETKKTIAIIDSGSANISQTVDKLVDGYDFVDNDTDATNDTSVDGHGTFLASIVSQCTENLPIYIMPIRVLSSKTGSLINVVNGIYYAVDNGADVINISLGGILDDCSSMDDALSYAEQKNASVVVCAGNLKKDTQDYCPAHNETAITVSSINSENQFCENFSNYGSSIDLAAPGEKIEGYNAKGEKINQSGTSMSAAFVSAAVGMFRLANPKCNTKQVHDSLSMSTEDLGQEGWDKYYGWGTLKLSKLLVNQKKYVESLMFPAKTLCVNAGEKIQLNPILYPADASDKSFKLISSSNTVSIIGNEIIAYAEGNVCITAVSNDGHYKDTCQIQVVGNALFEAKWVFMNGDVLTASYIPGEELIEPEAIDYPGYVFLGWNVEIPPTMPEKNLIFIAEYEAVSLECTYCGEDFNNYESYNEHIVSEKSHRTIQVSIENNVGVRTIKYGETLKLMATTTQSLPENMSLWWFVDGEKVEEGNTCFINFEKGTKTVAVKILYSNGSIVKDLDEKEICDSQKVTVQDGFFWRIISFFKNLFHINREIV